MGAEGLKMNGAHSSGKHYINLQWGKPNPSLLPITQLAAAAQSVFADTQTAVACLEYNEPRGHLPLRRELSGWLSRFYDAQTSTEQLCITGGASQCLATALQLFTDPPVTEAVWMIEPCYFNACRVFEEAGLTGKLRPVLEDEHGIVDLDRFERELSSFKINANGHNLGPRTKPQDASRHIYRHVIYVVPTFSNPAGAVMSLEQRQRLVDIARAHDALIVSDDVYDVLQWPVEQPVNSSESDSRSQLPRLIDIERQLPRLSSDPQGFGHVMSNASFSKFIAPGLRCGWVDASEAITFALSDAGSTRGGGCPSGIIAPMVANLLQDGTFERHIRDTLVPAYRRRRELMVDSINEHLLPLGARLGPKIMKQEQANQPAAVGGFFLWLRLPFGLTSREVVSRANQDENVVILPGIACVIQGRAAADVAKLDSHVRLCFAWSDEQDLAEGVYRLANVIKALQKEQTSV